MDASLPFHRAGSTMTQTAPPSANKTPAQANNPELVPPDERFWQRYSPHAEFPLSSAGSLAVHILIFGLLGLMAWLGAVLFSHANRSLPVEAVRLDLGGGGGNPHGRGDDRNNGAQPIEDSGPTQDSKSEDVPTEDTPTPKNIEVKPGPQLTPKFSDDAKRFLQERPTGQAQAFQKLSDVTSRIRVPDSGHGQGGTGRGGGSGDGQGTGVGKSQGPGHGKLTQREKRMLRWSMLFNTDSGPDYVGQLKGLGAILAIPIREDANGREYRIVRDLGARPAKMQEEDISQIQRIYWIDDKPQSVRDVLRVLGIELPTVPSHFVAFMPEELEKKLYELEKAYLDSHYRGRSEDDITETQFQIDKLPGGKYKPKVKGLKVKR
jgi:hypothetical protein